MSPKKEPVPPAAVAAYYAAFPEETRLASGSSRLELERTKEVVSRLLRKTPSRILDVGGGAGAYSFWLAELGHEVHLVDAAPRLVEEARRRNEGRAKPITSLAVADARALPQPDSFADLVLVMGPLYHLPEAADRIAALREAFRVLVRGGSATVAAISRYASALDGLARNLTADPRFVQIRDQDLLDGQHRNPTERVDYFTTSYFHRPEDLRGEMEGAGFMDISVLGVEGPGWLLSDFDERWGDPARRKDLLDVARRLEKEPSVLGVSAHLLGVGRKG